MDPQLQAILQALMGGTGAQSDPQFSQGADFKQFSLGGGFDTTSSNNALMRALGGFSPVNTNPNYGQTVSRFFNQNPLAGPQAFTGASPLQSGTAGNNAVRSGTAHGSFVPNDFGSTMQPWT